MSFVCGEWFHKKNNKYEDDDILVDISTKNKYKEGWFLYKHYKGVSFKNDDTIKLAP